MAYINLAQYGIEFKNLISGPCPIGRIFNYIKLVGSKTMFHVPGYRSTDLKDNVLYSWSSDFIVGLGLIKYGSPVADSASKFIVELTSNGKLIYDDIKSLPDFNESHNATEQVREKIIKTNPSLFEKFIGIVKVSPVFINLREYLYKHGHTLDATTFYDDYFSEFLKFYEGEDYNADSRTTTGDNRVPSLIQVCQFCCFVRKKNNTLYFNSDALACKEYSFIELTTDYIESLEEIEKDQQKVIDDLIERFGYDGETVTTAITRISAVQQIFRTNLIAKYGCKCMMCNINVDEVLIASHIKPSAISNVCEKADCENGLLLCPNHDKLFDKHLISFDFISGKILISKKIKGIINEFNLDENFKLDSKYLTTDRKKYLMLHRAEFEKKNK